MPVGLHDRVQWALTPLRPGTHWGPKAHNMSLAPTASAVPCDNVSKGILNDCAYHCPAADLRLVTAVSGKPKLQASRAPAGAGTIASFARSLARRLLTDPTF